jgi:hypothetical protein
VKFSAGVSGYAFQDQDRCSVFLVWRQGRGPNTKNEKNAGNTEMNCTMSFSGIADGSYAVEDLFNATNKQTVVISGGGGTFSFPLERWDCRAFRSDLPSPNQ